MLGSVRVSLLTRRYELKVLGGLQVGGGITVFNAKEWIDAGASKVRLSLVFVLQNTPNLI